MKIGIQTYPRKIISLKRQNWLVVFTKRTLLVLISIQAIVMSEHVYFNEPSYENQAGTPEDERANWAY